MFIHKHFKHELFRTHRYVLARHDNHLKILISFISKLLTLRANEVHIYFLELNGKIMTEFQRYQLETNLTQGSERKIPL